MENQEKEIGIELVKGISKKYLEYERSFNSPKETTDLLKNSLEKDISQLLSLRSPENAQSEDGCLTAEFLFRFCQQFMEQDKIIEIRKNIDYGRDTYPIGKKLNDEIQTFNFESYKFLASRETRGTKRINLQKFENPLANIVISTTLEKSIISKQFQSARDPSSAQKTSIGFRDNPNQFEVTLQK